MRWNRCGLARIGLLFCRHAALICSGRQMPGRSRWTCVALVIRSLGLRSSTQAPFTRERRHHARAEVAQAITEDAPRAARLRLHLRPAPRTYFSKDNARIVSGG